MLTAYCWYLFAYTYAAQLSVLANLSIPSRLMCLENTHWFSWNGFWCKTFDASKHCQLLVYQEHECVSQNEALQLGQGCKEQLDSSNGLE